MSTPPLPALDAAWQALRASLEWAREFSLIFVFVEDATAKEALFRRADDLMRAQVRPFQRPQVRHAIHLEKVLLPLATGGDSALVRMGMPLWLDLDAHAGVEAWDAARIAFLHRLNERRASLVREHPRAVLLVLQGIGPRPQPRPPPTFGPFGSLRSIWGPVPLRSQQHGWTNSR